MNYWQKIKNWLIVKLGGHTSEDYRAMESYLKTQNMRTAKQLVFVRGRFSKLKDDYQEQRVTLDGLKILETKIETFKAEGAFPYIGRSGIQLQRRIAEKKTAVVNSLVSDILQQNRFFVIDVDEESNVVKVSATISVLEGGIISGKETQLQENAGGAGDSRESSETQKDD